MAKKQHSRKAPKSTKTPRRRPSKALAKPQQAQDLHAMTQQQLREAENLLKFEADVLAAQADKARRKHIDTGAARIYREHEDWREMLRQSLKHSPDSSNLMTPGDAISRALTGTPAKLGRELAEFACSQIEAELALVQSALSTLNRKEVYAHHTAGDILRVVEGIRQRAIVAADMGRHMADANRDGAK